MYGHRKEECPQDLSEEPTPLDHQTKENSDNDPKSKTSAKAGIEVDMDNPEVTENFEPWMLARRRIRTSQNFQNHQESMEVLRKGKEGPKQFVASNLGAGSSAAEKSKFSILDLEGEENLPRDHDEKDSGPYENIAREEEPKRKGVPGRKGKRANVQLYDPSSTHANSLALERASTKATRGEDAKGNTKKGKERKFREKKVGPNQAAAEESHWVVARSTKTNVILRERVIHDSRVQPGLGPSSGCTTRNSQFTYGKFCR